MKAVLKYITETFNLDVLALLVISSVFLILLDAREFKKKGLKREYKFSRFFGIFYIVFGLTMYLFAKFIRI